MSKSTWILSALTVGFASSVAVGHSSLDLSPKNVEGKVVTYGFDDVAGTLTDEAISVFGIEVPTTGALAYTVNAPGINARPASALPAGSTIGFNLVGPLLEWNGSELVPSTSGTGVQMEYATFEWTVTGTSGNQSGIQFINVGGTGGGHDHLRSNILDPVAGIYALGFQVTSSSASVLPSDTVYLVYNVGGEAWELAHEEAIGWAEANLIPEPGALGLLTVPALALMRRRRK